MKTQLLDSQHVALNELVYDQRKCWDKTKSHKSFDALVLRGLAPRFLVKCFYVHFSCHPSCEYLLSDPTVSYLSALYSS